MMNDILKGAFLALMLLLIFFIVTARIDILNYKEDIFIIWDFLLNTADKINEFMKNLDLEG